MQTATSRGRRAVLRQLTGSAVGALLPAAGFAAGGRTPAQAHLAAAWDQAGRHYVGVLAAVEGCLRPSFRLQVPTRAHGLAVEPQGTILVAARRPGDWLLRFDPRRRALPDWCWSDGEYAFNGHVVRSGDGSKLFTTETARDTGAGFIAVRDAATFGLQARWASGGTDPHELVLAADGGLWITNGGIETRTETGRTKHDLERMDSSLTRLDAGTGKISGQWRLADRRLGLRHLAVAPDGTVGIALQAEHDDAKVRQAAPVLALWDGQRGLRAVPLPQDVALAGYGGSIAVLDDGFAVSCPRADRIARWRLADGQARWQAPLQLPRACAIASGWIGGEGGVLQALATAPPAAVDSAGARHWQLAADLRLDNHWSAIAGAAAGSAAPAASTEVRDAFAARARAG